MNPELLAEMYELLDERVRGRALRWGRRQTERAVAKARRESGMKALGSGKRMGLSRYEKWKMGI